MQADELTAKFRDGELERQDVEMYLIDNNDYLDIVDALEFFKDLGKLEVFKPLNHVAECFMAIHRWYHDEDALPGSFVMAVIRNDLQDAAARADDVNKRYLYVYAFLVHNIVPRNALQELRERLDADRGGHAVGGTA